MVYTPRLLRDYFTIIFFHDVILISLLNFDNVMVKEDDNQVLLIKKVLRKVC